MIELRDWKGAAERLGVKDWLATQSVQAGQRPDLSEAIPQDDLVPR